MGNSRSSLLLQEENIRQIEEETGCKSTIHLTLDWGLHVIESFFHSFVLVSVTANQIERLWSRFTSLDKQQKGYLTREDFLRIPELAINPLGDRIVHAFFRDGQSNGNALISGNIDSEKAAGDRDVVNFCDFVRVLAHFRPLKKNAEKNKMNSRQEKLKCEMKKRSIQYLRMNGLFFDFQLHSECTTWMATTRFPKRSCSPS